MTELADVLDLGSSGETREGSNPFARTIQLNSWRAALKKDIKVVATNLDENQVRLDVTVDKEDVADYVSTAYKMASKEYRIPGFRPGKAPRKVLDSAIGKQVIFAQATDALLNATYPKAVEEEALEVLGDPDIKTDELVKEGLDYIYHVELHIKPILELSSYDPVEVEMPDEVPTDDEINQQIDVLRGYYYTFEEVKGRKVKKDDFVVVDLDCERDGKKVDEFCVTDRTYELGHARIPADLEKAIVGMSIGEEKDVEFKPADKEEAVQCKVTLKGIRKKNLPDFDDDFAEKSGFKTAQELKDAVIQTLTSKKKDAIGRLKEDRALDELATRLEGEPSELQKSYIYNDLLKQLFQSLQQEGTTLDAYLAEQDITPEQFEEDVHKQSADVAAHELALDAVVRHQELECSKQDILDEFKAAGADNPSEYYDKWEQAGKLNGLRATILRAKAGRWLVDTAKVVPEKEAKSTSKKPAAKKTTAAEKAPAKKPAAKKTTAPKKTTGK